VARLARGWRAPATVRAALDDELIRRLLPECRRSMMGTQPGFDAYDAYDGQCLAETYAREKDGEVELLLTELEAWVKLHGGSVERRNRLRSGQRVAPDPGPPTVIFRLPRDDS
jgi:hypothetical protein